MNLAEVEHAVAELDVNQGSTLIYDLLLAYGLPKSGVTLLRKGTRNLSGNANEELWKNRVFYRFVEDGESDLHSLIDAAGNDEKVMRANPRFLIVQDGERLLAVDNQTDTTLDIPLQDLPNHSAFFMPWAGIEKTQLESLNYADVKAAEKMARALRRDRQAQRDRRRAGRPQSQRLLFTAVVLLLRRRHQSLRGGQFHRRDRLADAGRWK